MRYRVTRMPRVHRSGETAFLVHRSLVVRRAELALTIALACDRRLFGLFYAGLQGDYFWDMPPNSGVLVRPVVPIGEIVPGAVRPGDIDLLLIPYEGEDLILDRIVAIEVKIVRASYARQGRSPNEFGFSQAGALWTHGFPYVAVAHLIVSDKSPPQAWRTINVVTVLDEHGLASKPFEVTADMLPKDLVDRVYGRLASNAVNYGLGLAAIYVGEDQLEAKASQARQSMWVPKARLACRNPNVSEQVMTNAARLVEREPHTFLSNPRT